MKKEKVLAIIEKNKRDFQDSDNLHDFINSYWQDNDEIDNLQDLNDWVSEYADGLVPVYYNQIVKEWSENTDCHEMTIQEFGEYQNKESIFNMMSSDLYCYYYDQLMQDTCRLNDLIE